LDGDCATRIPTPPALKLWAGLQVLIARTKRNGAERLKAYS
jgi:hypothetical protein